MHLLNTDTLTHLYAGNRRVAERLRTVDDIEVGTTIITKIELLRGRMDYVLKATMGTDLLRTQDLLIRTEALLSQILIVPVSPSALVQLERLSSMQSIRKIGRADLLIASIVMASKAVLVSRNLRHFRQIPGLAVVNWVD
jgi:tRNA(fMet)-specific endonuclease VapC